LKINDLNRFENLWSFQFFKSGCETLSYYQFFKQINKMKMNKSTCIKLGQLTAIFLYFWLSTSFLQAQKPVTSRNFEIPVDRSEPSYFQDNLRISQTTGLPLAIYNPGIPITATTPEAMGREYLERQGELLGLSAADKLNMQLHFVRESTVGTTVRFRQYLNNLPVNEAEITISISPKKQISFVMNGFIPNVQLDNFTPTLSKDEARELAHSYLDVTGNLSVDKTNLMIFHHRNTSHLVYRVLVAPQYPLGEWQVFVDAHTGNLYVVEDITCYSHDHDTNAHTTAAIPPPVFVNGTGSVFYPDPLSSAGVAYGGNYVDNSDLSNAELEAEVFTESLLDLTLNAGNYELKGPYAEIVDTESPFKGLFTQTSPNFIFTREQDGFEASNTYFHVDWAMRYLNDSINVNVMPTQYTGGAQFDPSGLSGADNSHYTSSNGVIAFGEGCVDDAEDSDVIHHELGHALHDWITGGSLSQVNGLSEGCGDYWASSFNRFIANWAPADAAYYYMFNWDGHNDCWGGRITNYQETYPDGLVNQIHTDGQIWSTSMLKVWELVGRETSDRIFWEGLAMTNGSSNQDDAANAVYQAALNIPVSNADLTSIHTTLTNTGYTLPALVLPVELADFSGKKGDKRTDLFWVTSSEYDNDYFEIEHATQYSDFQSIGQMSGQGTTNKITPYTFTHTEPKEGINYYRLKQVDFDGRTTYSKVLSFEFEDLNGVQIYPNPVQNELQIRPTIFNHSTVNVAIINGIGKTVWQSNHTYQEESDWWSVSTQNLPKGIYWLQLEQNGKIAVEKFVKY
jgi:hypothetical protein